MEHNTYISYKEELKKKKKKNKMNFDQFKSKLSSLLVFNHHIKNGKPTRTIEMEIIRLESEIIDAYKIGIEIDSYEKVFSDRGPLAFLSFIDKNGYEHITFFSIRNNNPDVHLVSDIVLKNGTEIISRKDKIISSN